MKHEPSSLLDQATDIVSQLEGILDQLDSINEKIPAIHIDTAIGCLTEIYDIPRRKTNIG